MAAKTWNVSSGNWSTAGNWSPSGVPGTGDTVTVGSGRSCTIDANADFGNDSTGATPALTITGSGSSVTISSGVTVKCRGDLKIDAGYNATATLTLSSGSKFLFTPANNTAQFQFAATTYNHNKIVINGTSGARCTFGTDAVRYSTGGSSDSNVTSAYFPQAPYHGTSGLVTASYCDFYNMGSSSNWGLTSECATNGAGNGLDVSITNCTFTRCNYRAEQYGSETWDKNYTFQGNTFASSVACSSGVGAASCYAVLLLSTRSTGTRLIDSNVFDGVWTANSAIGCTVTRNVMLGACATSGGSAWDKFAGNAIRLTSTSDGAIALYQVGDTLETDEWNYLHMHNDGGSAMVNSHPIALPNTRSVKVRGWILDPGNVTLSGDQPDLIQPVAGPASAMTIDVSYNLSLPIAAGTYIGQDGGVLFGCSIDATNWKISATHNTACTSAGDAIARYGETNAGTAGMYGQTLDANHKGVKANLAWSATSNTAAIFSRISQNSVQNGLAAADGDYNATWNGRTTAGTHGDTWVRGYVDMAPTGGVAMFSTSTGLGANDKTLAGNPFYDVDMTTNSWRNIASWAVFRGLAAAGATYQAKVTAAYTYLKGNPTNRIPDMVAWIKDGWKVKDATLSNAGHDSLTIGALPYVAPAVPSSSHTHSNYSSPLAVRSGSATYFAIQPDGGLPAVGRYDHTKKIYEIGHPRGSTFATIGGTASDHNSPAVLVLSNGKILCCYSYYQGNAYASLSNNAGDVMGGFTETQVSTVANAYAQLCQTADSQGTIWWFFRYSNTGTRDLCYRINQGGGAGASWTAQASIVHLFAVTSQRPYFKIAQSGNRIDVLATDGHPNEVSTNSLYHFYLVLNSGGTQYSAYKSDGTLIDTWAVTGGTGTVNSKTLPLATTDVTKIYDGTTNKCSLMDLQYVGSTLYGLYTTYSTSTGTDDSHKYRRATYSGTSWSHEDICYAGDSTTPATVGRVPQWIYPDASTSEPQFSPGACLDPNTADRVYVGKKYGDGDVRIQQWDKSGTWSKTTDLTGASGNARVNARPMPVMGANPSNILWFSASTYTSLSSYTSVTPGSVSPYILTRVTKSAPAIWTPTMAYPGLKAMYLFNEGAGGSGATIAELTGTYNGSINGGSLTWGLDGNYGANLSGFSSTIAVIADTLAASGFFADTAAFPKWIAMLYKNTSSGTGQYAVAFGNSGSNNPFFGVSLNTSADNQVGGIYRDAANTANTTSPSRTRDSGWHTLFFVAESLSSARLFADAAYVGQGTTTTSTVTFDRFTIGAVRRTSQASPFLGTIGAVAVGQGSAPSPLHVHADMMSGQFLGAWSLPTLLTGGVRRITSNGGMPSYAGGF